MPTMSEPSQVFKIRTSDGIDFYVSLPVAEQIGLIQGWLEHEPTESSQLENSGDGDNCVFLDRVRSEIFELVVKWCTQFLEITVPSLMQEYNNLKLSLFKTILEDALADDSTMFELIIAADFLNIESLYQAGASYVAELITECESVVEIRKRFHITLRYDLD